VYVGNCDQTYDTDKNHTYQCTGTLCSFECSIVAQPCHFSLRGLSLIYFDAGSPAFNNRSLLKLQEEGM